MILSNVGKVLLYASLDALQRLSVNPRIEVGWGASQDNFVHCEGCKRDPCLISKQCYELEWKGRDPSFTGFSLRRSKVITVLVSGPTVGHPSFNFRPSRDSTLVIHPRHATIPGMYCEGICPVALALESGDSKLRKSDPDGWDYFSIPSDPSDERFPFIFSFNSF